MDNKPKIRRAGSAISMPHQHRLTDKKERDAWKKELRRRRDRDRQMVKGTFYYHECPGGKLEFVFKKYEGDSIMKYELWDGQMYELPLGVAKHLNQNVNYQVHTYQLGPDGKYSSKIGKRVKRCSFQSLDYTEAMREEHYEDKTIIPTPDQLVAR